MKTLLVKEIGKHVESQVITKEDGNYLFKLCLNNPNVQSAVKEKGMDILVLDDITRIFEFPQLQKAFPLVLETGERFISYLFLTDKEATFVAIKKEVSTPVEEVVVEEVQEVIVAEEVAAAGPRKVLNLKDRTLYAEINSRWSASTPDQCLYSLSIVSEGQSLVQTGGVASGEMQRLGGELKAVMLATKFAYEGNADGIIIKVNMDGPKELLQGIWKPGKEMTKSYLLFMKKYTDFGLEVTFER